MSARLVRVLVVVLAIVSIAGGTILAGRVGLDVYADLRTGLQVACTEQPAPVDADPADVAQTGAWIGAVPLGLWCAYPTVDGGEVVVAPTWTLSAISFLALGLFVLGITAAALSRRMKIYPY